MSCADEAIVETVPRAKARRRLHARSLAARLMGLFIIFTFLLLLVVTASLYWALVNGLNHADDEILLNKVHVLHNLLSERQPNDAVIAQEISEDANAPRRTYVRLTSASGAVVQESPGMAGELPPETLGRGSRSSGSAQCGENIQGADGRLFRVLCQSFLATRSGTALEMTVEVATDVTPDEELLAGYRTSLAFVLSAALLACAGAGYQIVRAGLRPIHRIAQAAEDIGASTLDRRLDVEGLPTELRRLAGTFNAMLERLDDSFSRLRQFSDDLAHELRTPINRLLVTNEVALAQAKTLGEYREVLGLNVDGCARLSQMIQNLLFLARSESPRSEIVRERIELAHELAVMRDFYEPLASEAGVGLSTDCEEEIMAEVDRSLLQRAIGNLITNAIAYTPGGGSVEIRGRDAGSALLVEVSDTGQGISAEHLPHLFDRFYRVDPNRSKADGNTGLGLAIVKSISILHGGSAEIESVVGAGTVVKLRLPK